MSILTVSVSELGTIQNIKSDIDYIPPQQGQYFNANRWVYSFLPNASKEFHWRELTNVSPQAVVIVGVEPRRTELPKTSLAIFRIDLPSVFNPALYAWPVKGVPTALVNCGSYGRVLTELCLEYGAPYVEVYSELNGSLEWTSTYPAIDEAMWEISI